MLENISLDVLETILNTLPVELSFVDKNDEVRYSTIMMIESSLDIEVLLGAMLGSFIRLKVCIR